ncbi:1,6-anhydro-N-acetylmuramyl-L-alanine amidase AmpD [Rhodocyclaceae bacterium]
MSDLAWQPDAAGWVPACRRILSPNYDERPADTQIDLLVIHAISLPPGEFGGNAVPEFFTNRLDAAAHPYFATIAARRVSAHFFIRRDGEVIQFVSCLSRAWHAGVSCWQGRKRCNDFSLGIELEGDDLNDYAEAQYAALGSLAAGLQAVYPIMTTVGHADIAPARKTDPGPHFDWQRLQASLAR